MKITRRMTLKISAAATATLLHGGQPLFAQSGELISKAIPSSGELLPVIGIGARNYRLGEGWAIDTSGFSETLRLFHQQGGRLVDTSPNYGDSESIVGDLLFELGIRNDLFLATKVDREDRQSSISRMEGSLKRMHTDHFQLMQVHNLIGWREQLPVLSEWKQEGRIHNMGITTSSNRQYAEMEQIMRQHPLDFIQVDYAMDNRASAERLLPMAIDNGIAVLVNLPFGRGRLFRKVAGMSIPDFAVDLNCDTWAKFFLKYVVSHPAVTVAIPGTTKPHHVVDNLGAARGELPDLELRQRMEDFIDNL